MRRRIALLLAVPMGTGVVSMSVLPTAAAAGDSSAEILIESLASRVTVLAVTVAVIFELALLYALVQYRGSGNAKSPAYNSRFQFAYILAVGLILFFVGFASLQTLAALDQDASQPPPEDAIVVNVTGQQWAWFYEYPDENVSTAGTVVVPVNETVHLRLTSRDVIHAFYVPDLALKRDANPAQWNYLTFVPTETGEYSVKCAEFCGQGHARMRGAVRVVNGSEYDRWIEQQGGNSTEIRAD